jgi:hypothetical protein
MNGAQVLRWHDGIIEMRALQDSSSVDDPWLFHGTSQRSAKIIAESGFDPRTSYVFVPDFERGNGQGKTLDCVFWTSSLDMALKFAEKQSHGGYDGFPVVFAARASDLEVTGQLLPDYNTWDYDHDCDPNSLPVDWRDALKKLSAIAVADCRIVPNLRMYAPDDLSAVLDPKNADAWFSESLPQDYPADDADDVSMAHSV